MYALPTLDDLSEKLDYHLDKAYKAAVKSVNAVRADCAKYGASGGSREALNIDETIHAALEKGLENALGEIRRAFRTDHFEADDLERVINERAKAFTEKMKAIIPGNMKNIDSKHGQISLDNKMKFLLRQFAVGLFIPSEPEPLSMMKNTLNIGTMHGGAIQQGADRSSQTVTGQINLATSGDLEQIRVLVDQIKGLLMCLPEEIGKDVQDKLNDIDEEICKTSPDAGTLKSLLGSVKAICEGATGSVAAVGIIASIQNFLT